jgi:hypothetical protein
MKKIYTDNKMVFGSINQAGGHLARLSAILTALRNGVAMGNKNTYLPSRVIDQETVKRAYQIVRFILQQKLCLFASKSDNEWPEMVDENDKVNWKIETDDQSERSMNVTTTGSYHFRMTCYIFASRLMADNDFSGSFHFLLYIDMLHLQHRHFQNSHLDQLRFDQRVHFVVSLRLRHRHIHQRNFRL